MTLNLSARLAGYTTTTPADTEASRRNFIFNSFEKKLTSDNEAIVLKALQALGHFGADAEPLMPILLSLFLGDKDHVRVAVAATLGKIGEPAAYALLAVLKDERDHVRLHALAALGDMTNLPKEVLHEIAQCLYDTNPNIRQTAYSALKQIGTYEALEVLREFFR